MKAAESQATMCCNLGAPVGVASTTFMTSPVVAGRAELKCVLTPERWPAVLAWMRSRLVADPHGTGPEGDAYRVATVYLDTPEWDVFHRRGSTGRAKYRVRRYGMDAAVFLERKLKREGRVRKRRSRLGLADLHALERGEGVKDEVGSWFWGRLKVRRLRPVVAMEYQRVARAVEVGASGLRVTLDRDLHAMRWGGYEHPGGVNGADLLGGGGILEIKFEGALPVLVKQALEELDLVPGAFSKYRSGVQACGLQPALEAVT